MLATSATMRQPRFKNTEEMTAVILRFPGERLATLTTSFGAADIGRYTLVGTKGTLTADPAYEYAEGINIEMKIEGRCASVAFPNETSLRLNLFTFPIVFSETRSPSPPVKKEWRMFAL